MSKTLKVAQHRRRWGMWTAAVVLAAIAGMTVMALAKNGHVDPTPWGYIALMVAVLSALAGLALAYAMAAIESRGDQLVALTHR